MTPEWERNDTDRMALERIPYDPGAWDSIVETYPQAEVFHSSAWLSFLAASQGAEPVVAIVRAGHRPAGHFVGGIVRRYGVRILGSPLRGWTTQYMGFLLREGVDRRAAAEALLPFAFRDLGCLHVELADRQLDAEMMVGTDYVAERGTTFLVDLAPPEEAILGGMRSRTRTYIRQGSRNGLRAEVATEVGFADEYYRLLSGVFARQGLAPTYGIERVRRLIEMLQPTGQLLLLQVPAPEADLLAAGIFVGRGQTAVLWGAASARSLSGLHPNEVLQWEAIRYWRGQGALQYDMGGGGEYKAKYGGRRTATVRFYRSRYGILRYGRAGVRGLVKARQILAGLPNRRVRTGQTDAL